MKYIALFLTLVCGSLLAANNNPKNYLKNLDNKHHWFAYSVPAQANSHSMCCWNKLHKDKHNDFQSCDLSKEIYGLGSLSKNPITKNINIYVEVKNHKIKQLLPIGDSCNVNAKNLDVKWLDDVNQEQSINWLQLLVNNESNEIKEGALHVLSLHESKRASTSLFEIAKNNNYISEKAIFWLGESRSDGVDYLKKLYTTLATGDAKKHINFALAQSKDKRGLDFLKHIAKTDKNYEQKADAIFWLAQEKAEGVVSLIVDIINHNESKHLVEHSIFSLSQIEINESVDALFELAKDHPKRSVREKSLFWLAEVNPKQAKDVAMQIIHNVDNESEIDNAIFTLAQLSEDDGLFELLTGNYDKHIKKQALFWLSQSNDSRTIDKLQRSL